jgi:hypothetical protein
MEQLDQEARKPSSSYFVFGGGYGGGGISASRIKKLVKCLDTAILSIGCPNYALLQCLVVFW